MHTILIGKIASYELNTQFLYFRHRLRVSRNVNRRIYIFLSGMGV